MAGEYRIAGSGREAVIGCGRCGAPGYDGIVGEFATIRKAIARFEERRGSLWYEPRRRRPLPPAVVRPTVGGAAMTDRTGRCAHRGHVAPPAEWRFPAPVHSQSDEPDGRAGPSSEQLFEAQPKRRHERQPVN